MRAGGKFLGLFMAAIFTQLGARGKVQSFYGSRVECCCGTPKGDLLGLGSVFFQHVASVFRSIWAGWEFRCIPLQKGSIGIYVTFLVS